MLTLAARSDARMIQEIVMVKAHGFAVRIKPDTFAASKVADRHAVALVD